MDKIKQKIHELCGIDTRSLALFRIGLAIVILGDLLVRLTDLKAHYTDEGVLPRYIMQNYLIDVPWQFYLYYVSGNWLVQLFLFILAATVAICLLIGYRTRLVTFVSWLLLVSLFQRNVLILQGGDFVFKALLFWSIFLPLGARWSVDSRKNKEIPTQVVSVGSLALLLQVCFIYWFAALFKIDPTWTSEGTAVWYALSIEQYTTPLGLKLLHYPELLKWFTYITFYLEAFGPFFAFSPIWTGPLRFFTAVAFIFFHLFGLHLTMELAHFSYICTVGWLVFIPEWFWSKISMKQKQINIWRASWFSNILAAIFLVYIFFWNVYSLDFKRPPFDNYYLNEIGFQLSLDQYWDMFSPYPLKMDGWYVIPGKLRDGTEIDLYTSDPVKWDKPPLISATYPNDRWRSFMMNMYLDPYDSVIYLDNYARYLCRTWNESHPFEKQVLTFNIIYMLRENSFEKPNGPYEKVDLWEHHCF